IVGEDDDALQALGFELAGQLRDGQAAGDLLAARHCYGAVVENLEGNVYAGGGAGAHGAWGRMGGGAVADILEEVRAFGEGRDANPRRALAAHLRDVGEAAVDVLEAAGHAVASDAAAGEHTVGDEGRAVVRAAGAEARRADDGGFFGARFDGGDAGEARFNGWFVGRRPRAAAGPLAGLTRLSNAGADHVCNRTD